MADIPDTPHRYINRDKLVELLDGLYEIVPTAVSEQILAWVDEQPEHPRLVGVTAIAEIVGVPPSRISGRYRTENRLPPAWKVKGGYDVWPEDRIRAFAREDKASRRAWARKRQKPAEPAEAAQT